MAMVERFFSDALGNFLLGEGKFLLQSLEGERFLDGVQILALEVFDKGKFQGFRGGGFPQDDGDFREAGQFSGAPAAFSRNDGVAVVVGSAGDEDGLEDALFANGCHQLLERFVFHRLPRLVGVGLQGIRRAVEELEVLGLEPLGGGEEIVEAASEASLLVYAHDGAPGERISSARSR